MQYESKLYGTKTNQNFKEWDYFPRTGAKKKRARDKIERTAAA